MNYKEILENVLKNGQPKQAVRFDSSGNPIPVSNGTIGTFCEIFRHDMSQGFPLSTLRRLPYKSTWVELEGFIKGITDKKWYKERNCHFWDEWANPVRVKENLKNGIYFNEDDGSWLSTKEIELQVQSRTNDLGPIYGYQWRNFGEQYGEVNCEPFIEGGCCPATGEYQSIYTNINGIGYFGPDNGFDQLKTIVDRLKTNPYDRRMLCSAWNPNQLHLMGLPACHYSWGVVVYGNKLNLSWNQRSCDLILGVPQNITSYATLQLLLCKESGLEPGELVGKLEDCHIYENLLPKAKELAEREENELPTVEILSKKDGSFSIFDWEYTDIKLDNYQHQGKMDMGSVTV